MTTTNEMLLLHSDIHIKRHTKVKENRSPYDGDVKYWNRKTCQRKKK